MRLCPGLRARVLVEAAPVDGLGAEVEAALDLDAVHIEAIACLDVGALLALEIHLFRGVVMSSSWLSSLSNDYAVYLDCRKKRAARMPPLHVFV